MGKARIGKIDPLSDDFDLEGDEINENNVDMDVDTPTDLNNDFMSDDNFFNDDLSSKRNDELFKTLTNFEPVLRDTVNSWVGNVWDDNLKKYVPSGILDRKINEKGAAYYIGFIRTYAKSTNILTNLDQSQSRYIQKEIIDAIFLSMAEKSEEFEIKTSADIIILGNEIIHTAFLVLYGAEAGKYGEIISKTTTRHENISQVNPNYSVPQQKNKKGFFSNLRNGIFGG